MTHRTLVFLDDYDAPECFGWWCLDCSEGGFGYVSEIYTSRIAKRHQKETRAVLQEAS